MPDAKLTIRKSVLVEAPAAAVFELLTDPEQIPRCFPYRGGRSERRVGGAFVMHGGEGEAAFTDHGTITAYEPGRRFAYRYWSDNHGTERTPENHLGIAYELTPRPDGRTEVSVTHSDVPPGPYHAVMTQAWDQLLAGLKACAEAAPGA